MAQLDPDAVGLAGKLFLGWSFVALPWLAWRSKRELDEGLGDTSKRALFLFIAAQQVVLTAFALYVAHAEGIEVLPPRAPEPPGWLLGGALFVVAAATLPIRLRRATPKERGRLLAITPSRRGDLPLWLLICLLAGFGEEVHWRGVLPELLQRLGCGWHPFLGETSVQLAAAGFGLAHAAQGWRSAFLVYVFALGFHAVVAAGASLVPAMVVHAAYDLAAGLLLVRAARRSATSPATDAAP